jgi:hypothetical protein
VRNNSTLHSYPNSGTVAPHAMKRKLPEDPHKTSNNSFFFRRHTIYEGPPAERMACVVGDLNNDGVPEFVISTRIPEQLHWFGRTGSGDWEPHLMDDTFSSISVGGVLVDLTGNGRLYLIARTSDRGNYV